MTAKKRRSRSSKLSSSGRLPVVVTGVVVLVLVGFVLFSLAGEGDAPPAVAVDPHTGLSEFDIPVQDPVLVSSGRQTFETTCATCHGADLRGTQVGPSFLSVIYNPIHHPDEAFFAAAINGVTAHHWEFGDMAPVAGLTPDQLTEVVAYVRESQRVEGFEVYPPP